MPYLDMIKLRKILWKTRTKQTIISMLNCILFKSQIKSMIETSILLQLEFICTKLNTTTMTSSLNIILRPYRDLKT